MLIKRNKMNEYIIRDFLNDNITGYSAEHNGEWYLRTFIMIQKLR